MSVLRALQRIAGAAAHPAGGARLYPDLAEALADAAGGSAAVATLDAQAGALRLRGGTGPFAAEEGTLLPMQASLAGAAFSRGVPRASADVRADADAFLAERELAAGAYFASPLVADGGTVGVVLAARAPGEPPFGAGDVAALEMVAQAAAGAVAGAEAREAQRRARTGPGPWRTERQLREDAARLQAALRVGGVVAFEHDPSTGATAWTGDVGAVFGFASQGAGARLEGWIGRVHPDDRPRLRDALRPDGTLPRRLRLRMADRRQAVRLFQLSIESAERGGALMCALREAEPATVKEAAAPAQDGAMLRTFIRAVRHELGGPLSEITEEAQRLEREWIVQAEVALERPVQAIHAAAQRLGDLADRLAAIERDPASLVITGEGGVALHQPDDTGAAVPN